MNGHPHPMVVHLDTLGRWTASRLDGEVVTHLGGSYSSLTTLEFDLRQTRGVTASLVVRGPLEVYTGLDNPRFVRGDWPPLEELLKGIRRGDR